MYIKGTFEIKHDLQLRGLKGLCLPSYMDFRGQNRWMIDFHRVG